MSTPHETFTINFTNPKIREQFKMTTGLNADDNIEAFIAYLAYLRLDMLALQVLDKNQG